VQPCHPEIERVMQEQVCQNRADDTPLRVPRVRSAFIPSSCSIGAWILEPSATGLCKPDLHVFAKLFEDCLKRGLEAHAHVQLGSKRD
jgi:hypothetical protein